MSMRSCRDSEAETTVKIGNFRVIIFNSALFYPLADSGHSKWEQSKKGTQKSVWIQILHC